MKIEPKTSTGEYAGDFSRPARLLKNVGLAGGVALAMGVLTSCATAQPASSSNSGMSNGGSSAKQPNILVIMGDDVGWENVGAYNQGLMYATTPNLDKLAAEGMRFLDYYAEPSCTAGRANFITGELPIRTGLTTVGQAGAKVGMPADAPTIATALKAMGYETGQFGKNHLGDLNEYLPTVHGFDEFFGYLYHLDAMEDPFWHSYPKDLMNVVGPRDVLHSWATDVDDPTEQPRWGKIGRQKIEDEGPLPPGPMPGIKYNMETFDEVIEQHAEHFIDQAKSDGKPFFAWVCPTRVHVYSHLSPKYAARMDGTNDWYLEEAVMSQLDDVVGGLLAKLKADGLDDNTIVVFTTDNGAENFTWPDGGNTPFAGGKGTIMEGGMRVPMIIRWPGHIQAGTVQNGIMSGLDFFPTFVDAAGDSNITDELLAGKQLGDRTYKVHLDGYDQLPMLTGEGPSNRHEVFYFAEGTLGAIRIDDWKFRFIDQPNGWLGGTVHVDWPIICNLRLDPFERMEFQKGNDGSFGYAMDFFGHEFWRFVFVQQVVAKEAQTFIEYPPMQKGASFNLEAVKAAIAAQIARMKAGTD
ncbi:MAG TPA: arylsulfatase [Candidatus Acidoferrales bacterium]|nr:arylsulfatase [Candidatus Acidoferrales bacterium]